MSTRERLGSLLRLRISFGAFLFFAGALLSIKVLVARQLVLGHALGSGAIVDLLSVVAILGFAASLKGNIARRGLSVAHIVISLLALVTVVYASYFQQVPGAETFALGQQATGVGLEGLSLLSWYHLIFVIDLPFIAWFGFRGRATEERRAGWSAILGVSALMAIFAFAVSALAVPLGGSSLKSSYRYGLVAYQLSSILPGRAAANAAALPEPAQLQKHIDALTGRKFGSRYPDSPPAGAYAGKNLIMIQVEALQAGIVGATVEGQSVTPFLAQLIGRSDYFPNTYSQIGRGNTSDAEFMANTSLYPCATQASAVKYAPKELPSLPRLLKEKGYTAVTFHTNDASFWNRFEMYPALGFDMYYDRTFFGNQDVVGHGATDEILFAKTMRVLEQMHQQKKKFYAHIITVSSHYPFTPIADRGYLKLSDEFKNTQTGAYLEAQSYTDMQIGKFIGALEGSGLMDDSIVVIYGDHFGMRFENATEADRQLRQIVLGGRSYNQADYYNIPLIVHLPKSDVPHTENQVVGQIDIMPTMADLLGVSLADTPHFGRSAYVQTPTLLTRPSSIPTYIDDSKVYLGGVTQGEDRWYSSTSQKMLGRGKVPSKLEDTNKIMQLSDSYVNSLPRRADAQDRTGFIPNRDEDPAKNPFR